MLKELLESNKCFKLVCGAGNEDAVEVERLVKLYSMAGCKFFDLSAKPEIVDAAKRGLEGREAFLCVSVGIKGDPHVRKASIDSEKCVRCHKCEEICPQKAIKNCKMLSSQLVLNGSTGENSLRPPTAALPSQLALNGSTGDDSLRPLLAARCIGCGKCYSVCSHNAISFIYENKDLKEVLPQLIEKGIDCIELHAMGENDDEVFEKWNYINEIFDGILSICTARGHLSEEKMIERIKNMISTRKPFSTIVQADGFPMSGGKDDYKTTLQAIATAEIVQNAKLPVYIMLSGGTNSKTAELAHMCEIKYNGIAIGTFARKIVSKYIERPDFLTNERVFNEALQIAKKLVETV